MSDPLHASGRRIAFRAVLLVAPLVALAIFAPRIIDLVRRHVAPAGASAVEAEGAQPRPDRPPTDEEIAASRRANEELARAEAGWKKSTVVAPSDAAPDATGEAVRWFQGFGVSVESTPAGAQVLVNGRDVGRTPVLTSVQCEPGDEVRVEVRQTSRRPTVRTTRCRKDALVELEVELR